MPPDHRYASLVPIISDTRTRQSLIKVIINVQTLYIFTYTNNHQENEELKRKLAERDRKAEEDRRLIEELRRRITNLTSN